MDVAARVWDPKLAALVDDQLLQWLPTLIGSDDVSVYLSTATHCLCSM